MNDNDQPVITDNLVGNEPISPVVPDQKQPAEPIQPAQPVVEPKNQDDDLETYKKRYSDSSREGIEQKKRADALEQTVQAFKAIYEEDPEAYEAFRKTYNKKVDSASQLPEYSQWTGKTTNPQAASATAEPAQPVDVRTEIDNYVQEQEWKRESEKAYGKYHQAYPNMDPKGYVVGTDEYHQASELETKVVTLTNTYLTLDPALDPGEALIKAHKYLTGEEAKEFDEKLELAERDGLIKGLQKGGHSNNTAPGGSQSVNSSGSVTKADIDLASKKGRTPQFWANLRQQGMLD